MSHVHYTHPAADAAHLKRLLAHYAGSYALLSERLKCNESGLRSWVQGKTKPIPVMQVKLAHLYLQCFPQDFDSILKSLEFDFAEYMVCAQLMVLDSDTTSPEYKKYRTMVREIQSHIRQLNSQRRGNA